MIDRAALARAVTGNHSAALAATGIGALRGVVLFPIVTKLLSIPDYGLWVQLSVASSLLTFLAIFGMDNAVLRYLSGDRRPEKDATFAAVIVVTLAGAGLCAVGCVAAALVLPTDTRTRTGIAALGLLVIGSVLERFVLIQLRRLLVLWTYVGGLAVFTFGDVAAISGALVTGQGLVTAIVLWGTAKTVLAIGLLAQSGLAYRAVARPRWGRVPDLLKFGAPFLLVNLFNWVLNLSDRFLVGWFLDLTQVALYSASYAVGSLAALAFGPALLIVQPRVSGLWEDGRRREASQALWDSLERTAWSALPVVAAMIVFAPQILVIFTRAEYAEAAWSAVVVAVSQFVLMTSGFAEIELALLRHSRSVAKRYGMSALVNVACNVILLGPFGYNGAAVATLVAALVQAGSTFAAIPRALGWWESIETIAVALLTAGIGVVVIVTARAAIGPLAFVAVPAVLSLYAAIGYYIIRSRSRRRRLARATGP